MSASMWKAGTLRLHL